MSKLDELDKEECVCKEVSGDNPACIKHFIEKAADLEHARWSRWQKYMISRMIQRKDGTLEFDDTDFGRWAQQMITPYEKLSDKEKESDRREVRQYLPMVKELARKYYEAGYEKGAYEQLIVGDQYVKQARLEEREALKKVVIKINEDYGGENKACSDILNSLTK